MGVGISGWLLVAIPPYALSQTRKLPRRFSRSFLTSSRIVKTERKRDVENALPEETIKTSTQTFSGPAKPTRSLLRSVLINLKFQNHDSSQPRNVKVQSSRVWDRLYRLKMKTTDRTHGIGLLDANKQVYTEKTCLGVHKCVHARAKQQM